MSCFFVVLIREEGNEMAKNDFFVLAYKILGYLYVCMKEGEAVDSEFISPENLKINVQYWIAVLKALSDEELIKGVRFAETLGKSYSANLSKAEITMKGIEYLEENSLISKAREFLKEAKDIAVEIIG